MHVRLSRSRLLATAVAAVGVLSALVAAAPAARAATPVLPSQDPFYTYAGSAPLSAIAPGTVLKERGVSLSIEGLSIPLSTEQLLYRTTGELGQPTVTVTTVIRPLLSLAGTRIVAYQTAYDALGSECDPSYTLQGGNPGDSTAQEEELAIAAYVAAGFTVTVPDYEGTSLDWAAGQESGYGTLDAIRATESYLRVSSSTKVGMVGYSGGSIATEWASELAPSYAPQLHIVGAAAGGCRLTSRTTSPTSTATTTGPASSRRSCSHSGAPSASTSPLTCPRTVSRSSARSAASASRPSPAPTPG
jgi:hypothetical protein